MQIPKNSQTVLVTGASSGIGLELAHVFARRGYALVLVARRESELRRLAGELSERYAVAVHVLAADLSKAAAPEEMIGSLELKRLMVDILVNNAGFGDSGSVADIGFERQMDMIQVNVAAVTALTRLLLPAMLERGRGGILNVASTAAFQSGPHMAVYYATKAYVLSFTEALAEELKDGPIKVSCLAPGPTRTPFFLKARKEEVYRRKFGLADARKVALAGYEGWQKGRTIVVPGFLNKMGVALVHVLPRCLVRRLVGNFNL